MVCKLMKVALNWSPSSFIMYVKNWTPPPQATLFTHRGEEPGLRLTIYPTMTNLIRLPLHYQLPINYYPCPEMYKIVYPKY